jgi:hypothetical protein
MLREEIEQGDKPNNGINPIAMNQPYESQMADEAYRLLNAI